MKFDEVKFKEDLRALIAKNKIEKSFQLLICFSKENNRNKLLNSAALLSSQYENIRRKEILNLPFNIKEKNLVIHSLLELIQKINNKTTASSYNANEQKLDEVFNAYEILNLIEVKEKQERRAFISINILFSAILIAILGFEIVIIILLLILVFKLEGIISIELEP